MCGCTARVVFFQILMSDDERAEDAPIPIAESTANSNVSVSRFVCAIFLFYIFVCCIVHVCNIVSI